MKCEGSGRAVRLLASAKMKSAMENVEGALTKTNVSKTNSLSNVKKWAAKGTQWGKERMGVRRKEQRGYHRKFRTPHKV